MRCPSCGAEIGTEKSCEFCGTQISSDMLREREQLNKRGCPKCGSPNIQFKRENQGEIRRKKSKQVIHRTVGFCKDCGCTWTPGSMQSKKQKTWLWVLGWLCIFPVPLTILLLRNKAMKPGLKYGIIAAVWIVCLLIGFGGAFGKSESPTPTEEVRAAEVVETSSEPTSTPAPTETPKPTEMPKPTETPKPSEASEPTPGPTAEQQNALRSARSYLGYTAFSHDGLIGQLLYEGYSEDDAAFAADNCGADWNEQAEKSAKNYLGYSAFSYSGLIEQLEYEKFTTEEATYGVDHCGADWMEQAVKSAKSYLAHASFSRDGLISQLEYEGFTHDQAVYGAEQNGY